MPYAMSIGLALGTSRAGLTDLRAQLVDTTGANVGSAVSTGFTDMGQGNYQWYYASFPDGHRGGVKFYSNAAPSVTLAFAAINPEEAEYTDTKTSGIVASVWTAGTRTLTSFGSLVSDIWAAATRTLTDFGFTVAADMVAISGDGPAADALETMLDGTGGNKLHLRQLVVQAGTNEAALDITGNGTGAGVRVQAGANAHAIQATGGASSGSGLRLVGQATGSRGLDAIGGTDGVGIYGQASGAGAGIMGGALGNGPGIYGLGGVTNGPGARFQGRGTGAGMATDSASGKSIDAAQNIAGNLEGSVVQLTATGNQAVADALLDRTDGVETSLTLKQAMRLLVAASAGKLSGAATTTITIRNYGDTKNRITATVDGDGNRTAVSYDVS